MLGQLKLPLTSRAYFTVTGGPSYEAKNYQMVFVKMAKEIAIPCNIDIPTRDFSVPDDHDLAVGLERAVDAILSGLPVYVGCMAGRGRTGLFLAILARAFGMPDPVEYVRELYYPHAVETDGQYDFVMNFPIPQSVLDAIARKRFFTRLQFWKRHLTNL